MMTGHFIRHTGSIPTPYLYGPLALEVGLDPLQPVRVLLLPHALVDLGAQLLGPLQGLLQGAAVGVALRRVFQDLSEEKQRGRSWTCTSQKKKTVFAPFSDIRS